MNENQKRLAAVMADASALMTEHQGKAMGDEARAKLAALIEEAEGLKSTIEQGERLAGLEEWGRSSTGRIPLVGADAKASVTGWEAKTGGTEVKAESGGFRVVNEFGEGLIDAKTLAAISTADYKNTFRTYLRKGLYGLSSAEIKTLQEGTDTAGGFLVPEEMLARIIERTPTPTRVQSRVMRFTTSRDRVSMPKVNYSTDNLYTTGMRVTWTGEVPASSTTHRVTDPVFGQVAIDVHTAMMSLPITRDLIEDSAFPLMTWVSGKFQETSVLTVENIILNGTGVGQPAGILRNPNGTDEPATVVSGAAAAYTWDGLLDIYHAVPEQYDANSAFVFNKTSSALALSKLKDGDGRPLWSMGVGDSGMSGDIRNRPLLGVPVLLSGFMPNVSANTYPLIFGDLSGYYLADRVGFSIQVLSEVYAETNQLLFLGRMRLGGLTAEPWRLKIQKIST